VSGLYGLIPMRVQPLGAEIVEDSEYHYGPRKEQWKEISSKEEGLILLAV